MNNSFRVCIIVLLWNGEKWINSCLNSIYNSDFKNFNIIVVDNGSIDRGSEIISEQYPVVQLIRNKKNIGFAGGCNIGIKYALNTRADLIVLLNQDLVVEKQWLSSIVSVLKKYPEIGIASPMQYTYNGTELDKNFLDLLLSNSRFKNDFTNNNELEETYELNRVIGAAMVIRRSLFLKVGLFDPLYFAYGEETDLCRRAIFHGFKISVITASKINHWHTLINQGKVDKKLNFLFIRNQYLFILKDPKGNFLRLLYYYVRWDAPTMFCFYRSSKSSNQYIFHFLLIQIWLFVHLPIIFFRRYNDVWIGINTIILSGVKIENGVVIGAGSVVTKSIPPYAIAAGNPAKKKGGYRFSEDIIKKLLAIKWWDWADEKIIQNYKDFYTNVNTFICKYYQE